MATVEMLEAQIQTLGAAEFSQLDEWFIQHRIEREPRCAISGMTAAESMAVSRSMAESLRNMDYSQRTLIKA